MADANFEVSEATGEVIEIAVSSSGFTKCQIDQLSGPLGRSHIKQREQAGRKLSYIESWHAIAEANRIFGFAAWNRETVEMRMVSEAERQGQRGKQWWVGYVAKVRVTVGANSHRVVREGTGFGSGIDQDLGRAHESAVKEAESDAMKRALMTFGNPFGLALYDKDQAGVEEMPAKSSAEPAGDGLADRAWQAAGGGMAPLQGFWSGLTKGERSYLGNALLDKLKATAGEYDASRANGGAE